MTKKVDSESHKVSKTISEEKAQKLNQVLSKSKKESKKADLAPKKTKEVVKSP